MTPIRSRVAAATMPTLLVILAIVVGLAAFSVGTSLGESDTSAFDAEIRSVQSMLDAYHADEGATNAFDTEIRSEVQAILESHADR